MAKQPPRSGSSEPGNSPAQPAKPRRTRAGGRASRADAQAAASAPSVEDTFAARATIEPRNRSESMASSPSEEDIRLRAYQRYLERGGGHGMDFEDWLEAERELKRRKK
jgi:hypothetical protein